MAVPTKLAVWLSLPQICFQIQLVYYTKNYLHKLNTHLDFFIILLSINGIKIFFFIFFSIFSNVQINKLPLDSTYIDTTVCQEFITLRKKSWCQNLDTVLSFCLNIFYGEDDWALELVAHRGCGISILGDVQKPPGHGPWPPALGGPVGAGRGADRHRGASILSHAVIWSFGNSMIVRNSCTFHPFTNLHVWPPESPRHQWISPNKQKKMGDMEE